MFKSLLKYAFAVFLVVACFTLIVQMKYNMSVSEYLAYSMPLTVEEKEYLQENKKLVCSFDPEAPPYSFINENTGKPDGMIYDYMNALAMELGLELEFEFNNGAEALVALKDGDAEVMTAFHTKVGSPYYLSAQKLYKVQGVIVSKADSGYAKNARDLDGKKVALVMEAAMEDVFLKDLNYSKDTRIVKVARTKEALDMLLDEKCDAVIGLEGLVRRNASEAGIEKRLYISTDPMFEAYMTVGVNCYDTTLLNVINKGLLKIKKKDIVMQAERKWLGDSAPAVADNASIQIAQYIMLFCVTLVLFLMFWEGVLNRRIEAKTRELSYQKNNMQQVIDSMSSMLLLINKNNRIDYCNRSGCDIIGMSQDDLRRKDISEIGIITFLLDSLKGEEKANEVFYKGRYYNVKLENIKAKKGSRLLVCEDCTDKRFAEMKLRQQNKMIAVGQLSAGLAHEIRNPLGLIKNYSYILKGYTTDDMSKHSLSVIGESVDRINSLIENLLKFSRLSGDTPTKFDIGKSLENIFALEKKKLEKAGVEFRLLYPKDTEVFTREETIKLISYNLVNNAIDAMEEGKTENPKLRVKVHIDQNILYMQFKNNGPKISEEQIESIFNPFFTTKETGTGLGLYIVSSEISKLDGNISVSSTDKETAFYISIPMEEAK